MSTQQKLITFLRHFLYSRGKSQSKLLSMTLNELLLEIGLSNELLLKQSEADIKIFSKKLNKQYRNQLKSNLLQKKLMAITPSAGKIYTDLVAEKKHIDSILDANNINIKISIETFKLNNLENKDNAILTKKIQELHQQMETRQKIAEEYKHTVVENKKSSSPIVNISDDDGDSDPESTNAINGSTINLSDIDIDSNPDLTNAIHSEGGDHGQKIHSDDDESEGGNFQPEQGEDDVEGGNSAPEQDEDDSEGDHSAPDSGPEDDEGGNSAPEQDEDDSEGGNSAPESDDDDEAQSTVEKKEEKIIQNVIGIAICPRGTKHTKFQKSGNTWKGAHGEEKCAGAEIFGGDCGGDEYRCREGKGVDMCCHNHLLACGKWMVEQIKKKEEIPEETFETLYKFCCNGYKLIKGSKKIWTHYNTEAPTDLQESWKKAVEKEIEKLKEKINKK